jgi:hypothetical protein
LRPSHTGLLILSTSTGISIIEKSKSCSERLGAVLRNPMRITNPPSLKARLLEASDTPYNIGYGIA